MNQIRVGVVGTGALGRHHARILAGLDGVELTAVADTNEAAGRKIAEQHDCRWFDSHRHLVGRVDAVSIVVPTIAHLAVAEDFLSRGIPTLVEKPLAVNVDEAERLVAAAAKTNTVLQVGHIERFNPATEAAWSLTGPPKYIRAERLSPYAFRSTDIGAVLDLMIHDLDLVLDLVRSPIASVEAFGISILGGHEDSVQARLRFENGCIADVTANRVNPEARRQMQIWSHTGMVDVDLHTREVVARRVSDAVLYGPPAADRARQPGADVEQLKRDVFEQWLPATSPDVSDADALTAELSHFVHCVRAGEKPVCSGEEGLAAMRAAAMVLESVARHQWEGRPDGAVGAFPSRPQERRLAG